MMIRPKVLFLLVLSTASAHFHAAADAIIRDAAMLNEKVFRSPTLGAAFDITATIIEKSDTNLTFCDPSGASRATTYDEQISRTHCANGDLVRLQGSIIYEERFQLVGAICTNLSILRRGEPQIPIETSVRQLVNGRHDFQLVRFKGTLRNVFRDEIDTRFAFLLVDEDAATVPVVLPSTDPIVAADGASSVGATVEITGICSFGDNSIRRMPGRMISASTPVRTLCPPPADPFDVPILMDLRALMPSEIAALGRRRVSGVVLASFGKDRFILRTDKGFFHTIQASSNDLPNSGETVTAVGYPETDLYHTHLTHAVWKREKSAPQQMETAARAEIEEILRDHTGHVGINPRFHGQSIRLRGVVDDIKPGMFQLRCDGHPVEVDTASFPEVTQHLQVGSSLDVSGICLMNVERWHPHDIFPRIRGFSLAIRSPKDVQIIARPPWWTPARLFTTIGILLSLLVGIIVWNILLYRVAERRGQALANEKVAVLESEFKTYERTRLAVELHDSIAQSLIGAAMEIKAVERFADSDPAVAKSHLSIAAKTIDSCRSEVRNCIYDLRSNTLEEEDLNVAIRQALEPHLENARLVMRFNIPRETLSVNALHTFIRTIRELTINAIRHGKAHSVWVAGSCEGDLLRFSVRDDGCGFDPDNCPGMEDGHFGLQGIRERIKQFGGALTFEHQHDGGMKATITIRTTAIK